jgi:glycosyltransferase involved in cell wall biosynthesis
VKILYLNPDPGIPVLGDKGASVHVREFVAAAAHDDHEVTLVCARLGEGNEPPPARLLELTPETDEDTLRRECAIQGLSYIAIEDRVLRGELRRLAYDRRFVRQVHAAVDAIGFRPDFIYERYALFHCAGATLARTLGVPRLLEVNAPLVREQERFRGLVLRSLAVAMEKASYGGADKIIAVSNEVAAHVVSTGVPRERILTVPNGVDVLRFHPGAADKAIRQRFGDGPVVGFIGSFKPWHGTDFLIRAFAAVARLQMDTRLVCVGDGPELENVRADVVALGLSDRVTMTGRVSHEAIPAYLASMDVTVAPYIPQEDFYFSPLKVLESLAVGVPVVAPRIGQLETLVEDGKTGLLYTPGDERDFVEKTLRLLCDPSARRNMSAAARERAVAEFSWSRATRGITAAAAGLMEQKSTVRKGELRCQPPLPAGC